MMITKRTVYETSDGKTFASQEEAALHATRVLEERVEEAETAIVKSYEFLKQYHDPASLKTHPVLATIRNMPGEIRRYLDAQDSLERLLD